MRYYDESTENELTRSGVKKAVTPSTLPKNWTSEQVIDKGYIAIVEVPKPEVTDLQVVTNGGSVENMEGTRTRVWTVSDRFSEPDKAQKEQDYLAALLVSERESIQNKNRVSCSSYILSQYDEARQRNVALAGIPTAEGDAIIQHILNVRVEENRVFDLLDAATTLDALRAVPKPIWPTA